MLKKLRQENFSKSKSRNLLKIVFHLKWVKKLLSKSFFLQVHFGSRTVVHLFVDVDICDAAAQSLAMTNIASFSLVDADARRIRISFQVFLAKSICTQIESIFVFFQAISDGEKATLREYFRRNAIFFRVCCRPSYNILSSI